MQLSSPPHHVEIDVQLPLVPDDEGCGQPGPAVGDALLPGVQPDGLVLHQGASDLVVRLDDLLGLLLVGHDDGVLLELVHGLLDAPQELLRPAGGGQGVGCHLLGIVGDPLDAAGRDRTAGGGGLNAQTFLLWSKTLIICCSRSNAQWSSKRLKMEYWTKTQNEWTEKGHGNNTHIASEHECTATHKMCIKPAFEQADNTKNIAFSVCPPLFTTSQFRGNVFDKSGL